METKIHTLLETVNALESFAESQPLINAVVKSGDIYDLNKEEYQQKYSAFCATQREHTIGLEMSTYRFTLFYVDRLTLDLSNKIEIQSTAVEFFKNLLMWIESNYSLQTETGEVTTFTERFTAECAGAYMNIDITVQNANLCAWP